MFGRDAAHGLFLGMAEVVQAQRSGDDARRIFDAFQTGQGRKVLAAVLAEVKLKMPETVLAQAALDDPAPIASRAEIRLGLDRRPLGQRSFRLSQASSRVYRKRGQRAMSFARRKRRLSPTVKATNLAGVSTVR